MGDEAIQNKGLDCFAALAMTSLISSPAQVSPSQTLGYDVCLWICPNKRICDMNDSATIFGQRSGQTGDDDIFGCDVSDAALERAANTATVGGALSFPNAPTVSILVICCSFDGP